MKKLFNKAKDKLKRRDGEKDDPNKPQLITHEQSRRLEEEKNAQRQAAAKQNRTRSNAEIVRSREQLTAGPAQPTSNPRAGQTIYRSNARSSAMISSTPFSSSADSQPTPMTRMINPSLIGTDVVKERDQSSEDSLQEYQNDGTIAAVETTENMDQFNQLAMSHRKPKREAPSSVLIQSKKAHQWDKESPLEVDRFDVVPSPDTTTTPAEEPKELTASARTPGHQGIHHHGYTVDDGEEFFDQGRDRASQTFQNKKDWRSSAAAAEDSDEDLMPLATIIPGHLKLPEDHKACKTSQSLLEQQMGILARTSDSSGEESKHESEAASVDLRQSSNKGKVTRASESMAQNHHSSKKLDLAIQKDAVQIQSTQKQAKQLSFQNSLIERNLSAIEEPNSATDSEKDSSKQLTQLSQIENSTSKALEKAAALQEYDSLLRLSRKRTVTIEKQQLQVSASQDNRLSGRRENIYLKQHESVNTTIVVDDSRKARELSEKSYDSESELDLDAELEELERQEEIDRLAAEKSVDLDDEEKIEDSRQAGVGVDFLNDLISANFRDSMQDSIVTEIQSTELTEDETKGSATVNKNLEEDEDVIALIDQSEHSFIRFAQQKLVDNRVMIQERASQALEGVRRREVVEQRVLSEVCQRNYGLHEAKFINMRRNERDTCIAVSDEVVVIGTQQGTFNCYNRDTCRPYGRFQDNSPELDNNPVTCMNIHPLRTEYVVVGFQGGQFMICDLSLLDKNNMLKPKKLVKDHHKGSPIVSVKFCDWILEREVTEESKGAPNTQDKQAWMIASVDLEGRIVISCVRDVALGFVKASKFVILDPTKQNDSMAQAQRFSVLEPRFYNIMEPQGQFNDSQTWLALANRQEIQVLQVTKETCKSCFNMNKPQFYPSERTQKYEKFPDTLPVMAWGYGRSPCYKHRTQAMLAVAWGSLIQLVLLIPDDEKPEQGIDFRVDGQYFIAPGKVQDMDMRTSVVQDLRIEAMRFLSESVLLVYTSTHDIRVLYTQSFKDGVYEQPTPEQLAELDPQPIFEKLDSRLKLLEPNQKLTKEQRLIEMERRQFLSSPLLMSVLGGRASQTMSSFEDWVIFMTEAGYCSVQHMTWQEYVETSEQDMDSTWIDKFQKALDIFDGKIKGFKGVVDDRDLRQESMKAELKLLVTEMIDKLINQWNAMAIRMEKAGTPQNEVVEHFISKQRVLIKRSIEMCVDIWEPFFLFNELFQKFNDSGLSNLFAEELKPYILSGKFADTDMPESILVHHVLKQPQERFSEQENAKHNNSPSSGELTSTESPAESLEKIIVNLSFKHCSPSFQHNLLHFCKSKKLTTAHFYLAVNYASDQGIRVALHQLRTFYLQFKEEERLAVQTCKQVIDKKALVSIKELSADLPYREVIEKSAIYTGYKLLWFIRLTLLGKRFPSGHYEMRLWQEVAHEILDLITHEDFMKTLFEIDASAFFQIITIAFNNPSVQYDFLLKGRSQQVNLLEEKHASMTHTELIKRISDYCLVQLEEGSEVRLQYLFFIASIAEEDQETRDQAFYYKVTMELIAHHSQFLTFNRSLIQRQMTQKQMYRRLSRKGYDAPDKVKHVVLSEESIVCLLRKCEPLTKEQVNVLVESIEHTSFNSLKLMLYEKQEYYDMCLRLLVECESVSNFVTLKMRDRFAWIIQTYFMLEARLQSRDENTHNRYQFDQFENKIFDFAHNLTSIDSHKAVGLIDCCFKDLVSQHLAFANRMKDHPREQYMYTNKLLEINGERAKRIMIEYSMKHSLAQEAADWLEILNKNLELACKLEPESVVKKIKANIKQNFYPAEECLKVCLKYEQTEACAILCKKAGQYMEAVQHYITLVNKTINTPKNILLFKKELYDLDKHIKVTVHRQRKLAEEREMERRRKLHFDMRSTANVLDVGLFKPVQADVDDEIEALIQNSRADLIPMVYNKNFSMKEKFTDAIQLKIFIQQNLVNVSLLERVLKLLMKMIKSHPDEILRTKEQVWLMIIKMMFGLTQHEEMHKKRYCRRYLIVKTVSLVREILKLISLRDIIDGILKENSTIKFRSVKQLIHDIFWDKRVEFQLCQSAEHISFEELREHQNRYIDTKGDGLCFRYTRCEICRQNINKTSRQFVSSVQNWGYQEDAHLVIFDCSKESFFNHAFHERCLQKYIQDEVSKDKKASQRFDLNKLARCIVCYSNNQDIQVANQPAAGRRTGRVRQSNAVVGVQANSSDASSETHSSQSGAAARHQKARRTICGQTMEELQQDRLYQRLKYFEKAMGQDTLQCHNFDNFM